MRKKSLVFLVAMSMLLSMTACGSSDNSGDGEAASNAANAGNAVVEAPSSGQTASAESTPVPTPEATPAPTQQPASAATPQPTVAPTPEPTPAPAGNSDSNAGPTLEEFLACGYDTTLVESRIPGIYLGTYTYSNPNATYLEISEDAITLYDDVDVYRYTYDQVTTTDNKNFTINDGSGANITLRNDDNFNGTAYYFFMREENGVYASVQGGPVQVLNGKHLYDINCDDMGVWGCIPVTEEIKTKLTEGLVTDDYWVNYSYGSSWYSEVKSKVQTYTIRDFDGPLASQALTLQVYANEEDAKNAYNYLQYQHQYTELNGNMILYKSIETPLSIVDSYYFKDYFIGQSVYGQHCVLGAITEDGGTATYFSKPFSKEFGEYINQANVLFGQHIGEYYGNDPANYSYIRLSTIYTGSQEMGIYATCSLADGSSLQFKSQYVTDLQVDGNKVTLVSNDPMQETAAFLELVISEGSVQATLKSYEGIYDLTIENSSSKTATKEASFVVQKEVY